MKKILFIVLISLSLSLSLYGSENSNENFIDIEKIKKITSEIDISKLIRSTADYLDNLSAIDLNISNKLKNIADNTLHKLSEKLSYFNVKKAQSVSYEVRVTTKRDTTTSGTAVAITSDGTLITTYHNVSSYKKILVVDNQGQEYHARVGKISVKNDLAYLHIKAENIPFSKLAKNTLLGEEIHLLSYENLLLKGIVSQIKPNNIILNIEANKNALGAGVFNNSNELVSILTHKNRLYKTSRTIRTNTFHTITEDFIYKQIIKNPFGDNYDNSYCYYKNDLRLWKKHAKSYDFKIQEMHALFIGLCNKMDNKDLTTEQAEFIFEVSRIRLFGK